MRTKELILGGWCQSLYAQNDEGEPVDANSEEAARWCVSGALNRACRDLDADELFFDLRLELSHTAIDHWEVEGDVLENCNDMNGITKRDVLDVVARTMKRLK